MTTEYQFEHLSSPSTEVLEIAPIDKRIGKREDSPIFASLKEMADDPLALRESSVILSLLLDKRNGSERTKTPVHLQGIRQVELPTSQSGIEDGTSHFIEIKLSLPNGVQITKELLGQLTEFYAREVFKEEKGAHDNKVRGANEFPKYCYTKVWDYHPLDKRANRIIAQMKDVLVDIDGTTEKQIDGKAKFSDPAKANRRIDPNTGSVIFIGREGDLKLDRLTRMIFNDTVVYTDDVSAVPGILLFEPHTEVLNSAPKGGNFEHLPINYEGSGPIQKVILRIYPGYRVPDVREIDSYFITLLLADILAGRVKYSPNENDVGSVGIHYKREVCAIMAALNHTRFKDISLESLPGMEPVAEAIQEHLLDPLKDGRLKDAQDIMIVGAPGTGKTALTTAFSRIDTGVALVSINSLQFLHQGSLYLDELAQFHDRYGIYSVLVLQDAEALFTDRLQLGSDGEGAPIDPAKRQIVLEVLNGERESKVKFLLTINKPGYIDEALRRRFLVLYAPLPDGNDSEIYQKMAEASMNRAFSDDNLRGIIGKLIPVVARESKGYPQAFVAKLSEMLISPLSKLNGNLHNERKLKEVVGLCSRRLKDGYPIKEIRELDTSAQKVAAQTRLDARNMFQRRKNHV